MKEQEAIILMQNEITCINRADKCNRDCAKCDLLRDKDELLEAYNMAISALEKHISKKPKKIETEGYRYTDTYRCTTCGGNCSETGIADYCYHCGQKLDWSEV